MADCAEWIDGLKAEVRQQGELQLGFDNGLKSGQAVHLINGGHHIGEWVADGLPRRGFCRLDAVMPAAVVDIWSERQCHRERKGQDGQVGR